MMAIDRPASQASLLASVILTDAIGCAVIALVTSGARANFALTPWCALKALGMFSAIMLIALNGVRRAHPFAAFGPANQVTTLRAGIVSLTGAFIGEPVGQGIATTACVAGFVVALLDGVDGRLARQTGLASAFGARFDMEVDALLILVLSVLAAQYGKAGPWIVLAGLLRYLFVAAGWVAPWIAGNLNASWRRKAVCVVQVAGLSALLLPAVPASVSVPLGATLVAMLCWSFLVDVMWLWRHR